MERNDNKVIYESKENIVLYLDKSDLVEFTNGLVYIALKAGNYTFSKFTLKSINCRSFKLNSKS